MHYTEYMEELPPAKPYKVAIVGGGPAGLSAAYYLIRNGVKSTVFEQMPEAGGMLRYGIPEYRLPKRKVLDVELDHFKKLGIEFQYNKTLGKNLDLEELKKNYDAVILAVGCWHASSMRCEGEELAVQGIEFLGGIAKNEWSGAKPGRVIVVGGG